ncbi:MAG: ferric reductase-like transmembrane domain-containing protein, partial [Gemmatimonadota bacterium]|nr:ferric reductase-like transmembrane domain-containing protein [Gemmatimonadota bacterium]
AVNWNRQKRIYDALIGVGVLVSMGAFVGITAILFPDATAESMLIRGLGLTGFLLLQLIVLIGPLARLEPRLLPLLYNRRHLGVTMALVGLSHGAFSVIQYHALGNVNPLVSLLVSNTDFGSAARFPFELFGLLALTILVVMAATSHDFWLSVLGPPVWKALHMLVYVAYAAVMAHVALGFLQDERHPLYLILLGLGATVTAVLHLVAARREVPTDRLVAADGGWVDLGPADTIPEGRARIGMAGGERVAVFRHDGKLSCVSNVCRHQNGPLGEGKIVDGCVTCPWHGYQFRPDTGISPPPFDDRIPTYHLRVVGGHVQVREGANPPGTLVEPVPVSGAAIADRTELYVGYLPVAPAGTARVMRRAIAVILGLTVVVQASFAFAQRSYEPSRFEYGTSTEIEGTLRATPYPILEVSRPASDAVSHYLLAAPGKHGAPPMAAGLDGQRVRVRGTLAYRGNLTLLEIADAVSLGEGEPNADGPAIEYGTFELWGEVVDSKCWLGVMNPGRGKSHRACAARCLSGGLSPLFVVKDRDGATLELLLVTPEGKSFPDAERVAGRPIALRGQVVTQGDLWLFRADPDSRRELQ